MEKLQSLRKAKEDMLSMEKLQEERKIYDEKVSLSDHILDEIKVRCTKMYQEEDVLSFLIEKSNHRLHRNTKHHAKNNTNHEFHGETKHCLYRSKHWS